MKKLIKRSLSFAILFSICVTAVFNLTSCGYKRISTQKTDLNLDDYVLVAYDEFEGSKLNSSLWEYRYSGKRHGGFNHPDQVSVENGKLVITAEHRSSEYGEGWHSGMIRLKKTYTYGYFEIRCMPNNSADFTSSFWLQNEASLSHEISGGGVNGAQIVVFTTQSDSSLRNKNIISANVYCNGSDNNQNELEGENVANVYIPDLHDNYTTFGLMWTDTEYIFYVNGEEIGRSSFSRGTSSVPEEIIVSLNIPNEINLDKREATKFIIDYVKVYQLRK